MDNLTNQIQINQFLMDPNQIQLALYAAKRKQTAFNWQIKMQAARINQSKDQKAEWVEGFDWLLEKEVFLADKPF